MKLADRVIRIHAINNYIEKYCKDYIPLEQEGAVEDSAIDFEVTVTQSDIDFERDKSAAEDRKERMPSYLVVA